MSLKNLILLRNFSTARVLARPALSEGYKSEDLWDQRFRCKYLSDNEAGIKSLNAKIIIGDKLNNIELDILVNIASPRPDDVAQLQETARSLRMFRKSIHAHTLLPSAHHATCRLFISSKRVASLANMLDDRVKYGIFPDFFALNLALDAAIESEDYITAARIASQVMFQEEFGQNSITDMLVLYTMSKYIESKPDFEQWLSILAREDLVLTGEPNDDLASIEKTQQEALQREKAKEEAKKAENVEEDEDEEEDDAEYIRVPFLRNPYYDNHFDLKHPRAICGKSLHMLGNNLIEQGNEDLGLKSKVLGQTLQGQWENLLATLEKCTKSSISLGQVGQLVDFYMTELHSIEGPTDEVRAKIQEKLKSLSSDGPLLSDLAEAKFDEIRPQLEQKDIDELRGKIAKWTELRDKVVKFEQDKIDRVNLIEELRAKKEELKQKEQYIYFYDKLKQSTLTRVVYD